MKLTAYQYSKSETIRHKLSKNKGFVFGIKACGLSNRKNALIRSAVDYYVNEGLRGRALRKQLMSDYDISILLILQFAVVLYQIIKIIREMFGID